MVTPHERIQKMQEQQVAKCFQTFPVNYIASHSGKPY